MKKAEQGVDSQCHSVLIVALAACLFLFSDLWCNTAILQPSNTISPFYSEQDNNVIAFQYWNTNAEGKGHVYPYLASFLTCGFLLAVLIILICYGGLLG
jgi:hypothetical protein